MLLIPGKIGAELPVKTGKLIDTALPILARRLTRHWRKRSTGD